MTGPLHELDLDPGQHLIELCCILQEALLIYLCLGDGVAELISVAPAAEAEVEEVGGTHLLEERRSRRHAKVAAQPAGSEENGVGVRQQPMTRGCLLC